MKKEINTRRVLVVLVLLLIITLLPLGNSEIIFYKEAPMNVALNESFNIKYIFKNSENHTAHCKISQQFSNIIPITKNFSAVNSGPVSLILYSFDIEIPPNITKVYSVNISIPHMPISGTYTLPSASVMCEGRKYRDVPLTIKVTCNRNYKCEEKIGENPYNCPQDCQIENVAFEKWKENINAMENQSRNSEMMVSQKSGATPTNGKNILLSVLLALVFISFIVALVILVLTFTLIKRNSKFRKKKAE